MDVPRQRAEHPIPLGYLQIRVQDNGKRIHGLAHRLVWQYFFGNIPDGMCINHKNGAKDDNNPENLEIVTYSENMKHAFRNKLITQDGERNPNAKLSNTDVEEIRYLYATGKFYQVSLAKKYGVSFQSISKIVKGKSRKEQGGTIDPSDHREDYMEHDPKTGRFVGKVVKMPKLDGQEWREWPR